MVVTEVVAAIHHLMVMIDCSWVDAVVNTVVMCVHWDLSLDDQQATNCHDWDNQVVIVVVVHDITTDDQTDCLIVGEADQGLTWGLGPPQITWLKSAHAVQFI